MEQEKKQFRIHSFLLFLTASASGIYLVYLQLNQSDNLKYKLAALLVFLVSMFFATKNWVKDNPNKNKKNWSDSDKV